MSPDDDDTLPSITPEALDTVTGGTATNDDITAAVTALSNDLKDYVSNQNNQGSNFFNQMFPLLLIMAGGGNWSYSGGGFNINNGAGGCGTCGRRGCFGH
jgi:hypothetical protein